MLIAENNSLTLKMEGCDPTVGVHQSFSQRYRYLIASFIAEWEWEWEWECDRSRSLS